MKNALHRRVARPGFLAGLFLLVSHLAASAHPNLQDAMWVQFEPQLVRVAVNVSLKEIAVAQSVTLGESSIADPAAWHRAAERHGEYVLNHLTLSIGKNALAGRVIKLTPPPLVTDPEQTSTSMS